MYKQSLKGRLVISLLFVFILLWSCVFTWLYIDLKKRLQDTLDQRLSASAHMVARLIQHLPLQNIEGDFFYPPYTNDPQQLIACEVSLLHPNSIQNQKVVAQTKGAPLHLSKKNVGFSTWQQGEVEWRSYVLRKDHIQVVTAEQMFLRDSLLQQILRSVLIPLLSSLLLCIALIILIIRKEFSPLDQLSTHLSREDLKLNEVSQYLDQVDPKVMPKEVKPFVDNVTLLIQRLSHSLENEKAFSAYAAHELRSPLTAIKTNVQLAQMMARQQNVPPQIQHHLHQADQSIRRYGELLEQLLLLTQSETTSLAPAAAQPIAAILQQVISTLEPRYPQVKTILCINWSSLTTLNLPELVVFTGLKNLIENALLHANADQIYISMQANTLMIQDNGKVLDPEDVTWLGQRFWRKSSQQSGHGLGLALIQALLKQYQLHFKFNPPHGLSVSIEPIT